MSELEQLIARSELAAAEAKAAVLRAGLAPSAPTAHPLAAPVRPKIPGVRRPVRPPSDTASQRARTLLKREGFEVSNK